MPSATPHVSTTVGRNASGEALTHGSTPCAARHEACDVLVVGAGPAGSACAQLLARAGLHVLLADQHDFPRDKVCGDGLIPDAHAALERLGVAEEVRAHAALVPHVRVVAPRGAHVDVPGRLAVLPRLILDDIVRRAAVAAGAQWWPRARFEAVLRNDAGRVCGATFSTTTGEQAVRARWVVLATGAVPQALIAAGMCERRAPTGMALRGYVRHDAMAHAHTTMDIVWHRRLGRGYGWVFPCGKGLFNVGVGLSGSHAARGPGGRATMVDVNLRELFNTFCDLHAPARELSRQGTWSGALKGAPLRCSLEGARLARPGLLVTGEAAGSTYDFTGEGIGKAMETGMLAAETLLAAGSDAKNLADGADDDNARCALYAQRVKALKPRFDLYARADAIHDRRWLIDLLVWRANRSPRILQRMSNVIEERSAPGNLVSWRGLVRLISP